jgi:predicted DNA-binding transcriptional regulator AlpA
MLPAESREGFQDQATAANAAAIGAVSVTTKPPQAAATAITLDERALLSAKELARRLGRSVASIYRDWRNNRMPEPIKLGWLTKWRVEDIDLWIELKCPNRRVFEARRKFRRSSRT